MKLTDVLSDVGRAVAYYPAIAKCLGGVKQAIFVCEFVYWSGKGTDADGWIYKTQVEIEDETGLSDDEQLSARRSLKSQEIIEEKLMGMPAKLYYRVNRDKLNEAWENRENYILMRRTANRERTSKARAAVIANRNHDDCSTVDLDTVEQEASRLCDSKPGDCATVSHIKEAMITHMNTSVITHTGASATPRAVCEKIPCPKCKKDVPVNRRNNPPIAFCVKCHTDALSESPTALEASESETIKSAPGKAVAYYSRLFEQRFGAVPEIAEGKDYAIMKRLLDKHGADAVKRNLAVYLKSDDLFIKGAGYSLGVFSTRFNSLTVENAMVNQVTEQKPQNSDLRTKFDQIYGGHA